MLQDIDPQYLCVTERYRQLARLEAYYDGTQYDCNPKLKPFTDDTVPMRERRPDVIDDLPRVSVQQAVRFALGEGKFPRLRVEASEEADEFVPALAIEPDDAKALTRSIEDLATRASLASATRTAMRQGLTARTACLVLSIRGGRFAFDHPLAKDCLPTFENGDPLGRVTALTWVKQYDDVEADRHGRPVTVRRFFRRDYTDTEIVEYEPADVDAGGQRVEWRERERIEHGLGECPVVWIPNMAHGGCEGIDGVSLFDGLFDEFDALNRALSQRHHALEILGVPQIVETGVAMGDGPGAAGRSAAPAPTEKRAPDPYRAAAASTEGARKAGARHVWTYKGENVSVDLIETTGKAFEVASKHIDDIGSRLLRAMDVILLDPTTVAGKGDMSAKALALMYAPMLALVDELREWWWEHGIRKVLDMMLRIVERRGTAGLFVKGAGLLETALRQRTIAVEGGTLFIPPTISPLWGAYFAPSAEETKIETETAAKAKDAGLVSRATATSYVASAFGVADVEQELEAIEEAAPDVEPEADESEPTEPPTPDAEDGDEEDEDE